MKYFCISLGSLDVYMTTSKLIHEFHGRQIIEMLNNMVSLHYHLNNYEESRKFFEKDISYVEQAYANSINSCYNAL